MADEQILSREYGFELAKRTIADALNTPSEFMRAQAFMSLSAIDRSDAALRAQVVDLRTEHQAIIDNLCKALMPGSPLENARAEFMLDGQGACQIIDRLRAQVAAMTEWAAKVEHRRSCVSYYCGACGSLIGINKCSNTFCVTNESIDAAHLLKQDCNCHLSTLPADLIARGRELLDAAYMRGFADGTKGATAAIDAAICKTPAPKQGEPGWLADEVL